MDPRRFDTLTRALGASTPRRRLFAPLAALPLIGSLAALLGDETDAAGRRKRRKKRHKHQQGDGKENRKGKRKGCNPHSRARTCAGACATVRNNCGTQVDCGPCSCGACPICQTCNPATGQCIPDSATAGQACGSTGQTCGGGGTPGVCGCTPTTCAAQGKNCGTIPDGCGGPQLDCGPCDPSGARCCVDGVCLPDPADCLPLGTECDPPTTCNDCCSGAIECCFGPDNHGVCSPALDTGGPCTSQADCAAPMQCACGTCCCSTCGPGDITDFSPCNTTLFPDCVECP